MKEHFIQQLNFAWSDPKLGSDHTKPLAAEMSSLGHNTPCLIFILQLIHKFSANKATAAGKPGIMEGTVALATSTLPLQPGSTHPLRMCTYTHTHTHVNTSPIIGTTLDLLYQVQWKKRSLCKACRGLMPAAQPAIPCAGTWSAESQTATGRSCSEIVNPP